MNETFKSNGKLLLTGEYLVLDGALALAIPTKYGQHMTVAESENSPLHWQSYDHEGKLWYQGHFGLTDQGEFTVLQTGPMDAVSRQLVTLLNSCLKLNPDFAKTASFSRVKTGLDFPRDWGLGSSSTLINNLAQWVKVDAFKLLDEGFGGSGYDIACASSYTPLTYKITQDGGRAISSVNLNWNFTDELYFIHLNRKQDSKQGIKDYRDRNTDIKQAIHELDKLTSELVTLSDLPAFESTLSKHENLISTVLGRPTIKEELFPDYKLGVIKSLGAWGGDFILASGGQGAAEYFRSKGYSTIIPFEEMIIKKPPKLIQP